jgi:hypothetical protein
MFLSKRIQNVLFGKVDTFEGKLSVLEKLEHPDGTRVEWAGNDGLIFALYKRILKLEQEVGELNKKKLNK